MLAIDKPIYPDFPAHLKSLNMKSYKTADSFPRAYLNASWQTFLQTGSMDKLLTAFSTVPTISHAQL